MKRYLLTALLVSSGLLTSQTMAGPLDNALNAVDRATDTANKTANTVNAAQETASRFTNAERNTYKTYYDKEMSSYQQNNNDADKNGKNKNKSKNNKGHDQEYSGLPPGLQKKVASGKPLPPGWQTKVSNGQVFDAQLRDYSVRSPYASPKGTSTYILDNKVIRVMDATNVILDVLTN